jgi:PAS domain S-box-containing protein
MNVADIGKKIDAIMSRVHLGMAQVESQVGAFSPQIERLSKSLSELRTAHAELNRQHKELDAISAVAPPNPPAEERLQFQSNLLDAVEHVMIATDLEGKITYWNRFAENLYGWRAEEVMGRNILDVTPTDRSPDQGTEIMARLRAGQSWSGEYLVRRRDGSAFSAYVVDSPVHDAAGHLVGIISASVDLTERNRADAERRMLEREVLEISDREQRRIGQDLHDSLGQHLAGVHFKCQALESRLAAMSLPEAVEAASISGLIRESINQSWELARGLDPVSFQESGLANALKELAAGTAQLFGISCTCECTEPVHDGDAGIHIYRIAQEAISNSIKHGRAKHVRIGLAPVGDRVELTVRDDGVGIDLDKPSPPRQGMGLQIMRYRARMIGASFDIRPLPAGGTLLTCSYRNATMVSPP